jgi:hypothetical protein
VNSLPVTSTVNELKLLADTYPPMDHRTQQALAIISTTGDEEERTAAIELLYKHNASRFLYFVRVYAKDVDQERFGKLERDHRYMLRWKDHAPWTMTSDEVISASLAGFWRAVKTFDPARGQFNPHANVAIWREIQKARKQEEKRGSHIMESVEGMEAARPGLPEASQDDEKEIARIMFARHLERVCPGEAQSVFEMLDGKRTVSHAFLAEVGKRLRAEIPPGEMAWLEERLAWGD